tara:strand:+ start:750 stop:2066 length:1317 start_codon:yes stop_codon:yes gene_type:complete
MKLSLLLKNKYASNLGWTFIEKLINLTNTLVVGVFLARYLGPFNFGILSYSLSYVALFGFLIGLGLDQVLVKEIVKRPSISKLIVSTSLILQLVSLSIVFILINTISFFSNDSIEVKLIILIISLGLIHQPFNVLVCYFQAIVNIKYISIFIMISKIILILGKLTMIYIKSSLIDFVILDSFIFILLSITYFIYYIKMRKLKIKGFLKFNKKIAIVLLNYSWPLLLSSGAIILYMRVDQIMIKEMINLDALGKYAVAVKLSEAWYFLPIIITSVFYPYIIIGKKTSNKLYYNRLKQLFFTTLWIAILFVIFLSLFDDILIGLLFGNEFVSNNYVIPILAISGIFVSMGYVNGKWVIIENHTKFELIRNLIGGLLNVLLNFILIPVYGLNGAALSTLISLFIAANLSLLFFNKSRKIFVLQNLAIFDFTIVKKTLSKFR